MQESEVTKCAKCGKDANGKACAMCHEACETHNDEEHKHDGRPAGAYCMPTCSVCNKAEVHCDCEG